MRPQNPLTICVVRRPTTKFRVACERDIVIGCQLRSLIWFSRNFTRVAGKFDAEDTWAEDSSFGLHQTSHHVSFVLEDDLSTRESLELLSVAPDGGRDICVCAGIPYLPSAFGSELPGGFDAASRTNVLTCRSESCSNVQATTLIFMARQHRGVGHRRQSGLTAGGQWSLSPQCHAQSLEIAELFEFLRKRIERSGPPIVTYETEMLVHSRPFLQSGR